MKKKMFTNIHVISFIIFHFSDIEVQDSFNSTKIYITQTTFQFDKKFFF